VNIFNSVEEIPEREDLEKVNLAKAGDLQAFDSGLGFGRWASAYRRQIVSRAWPLTRFFKSVKSVVSLSVLQLALALTLTLS
jgi:hypothetical protein